MELPQEYQERAKQLGLWLYQPSVSTDYLIAKLWAHLNETGEIHDTVLPDSCTLANFMSVFAYPTISIYTLDTANDIDFIFWATPTSTKEDEKTVACGVWAHEKTRGSSRIIKISKLIYDFLFLRFDYCLALTWKPRPLKTYMKVGYKVVGFLPTVYGLNNVYTILMSRDNFYNSKFCSVCEKLESR